MYLLSSSANLRAATTRAEARKERNTIKRESEGKVGEFGRLAKIAYFY